MAELTIKIKGNSANAQAALKKAGVSFTQLDKKSKKSVFSLKNFKRAGVAAGVAILGAAAAAGKFIQAASEQQKQQVTLAAAMRQAGTFTEEAFKHNLSYASSLQKMTTFGDEAILGVQKMLTNFGLEGEALDKTTKATLDLAAAKGMDLKSAADLVAKSVGSSTNALTRYGIEVKGAAGSTERAESAVANITKLFGGAAAAEAETFAGQMKQIKNTAGDVTETLGFELINALTPSLDKLQEFLKSEEGMKAIENAAKGIATAFLIIQSVVVTLWNAIQMLVDGLVFGFKVATESVTNFFRAILRKEPINIFNENWNQVKENMVQNANDIKDSWTNTAANLQQTWSEAASAQQQDIEKTVETYKAAAVVIEDTWRQTMQKMIKAGDKWFTENKKRLDQYMKAFNSISSGLVQIEQNKLDKIDAADTEARQKQAKKIQNLMKFEKATKMASAAIDTAAAILKTMASVPFPANVPLAIAQGVAGAVQMGTIASTPIPSVADLAAPHGADFTTDGPTTMTVGDNPSGRERVSVTPEEDEGGGGENVFYIDQVIIQTDSPEDFGNQMKELGIRTARRA
jgi:hypothetical protein